MDHLVQWQFSCCWSRWPHHTQPQILRAPIGLQYLTHLFNRSFNHCNIPAIWKHAIITLFPNLINQQILMLAIAQSFSSALLLKSWNTFCNHNLTRFLFYPTSMASVPTTLPYPPSYLLRIIYSRVSTYPVPHCGH